MLCALIGGVVSELSYGTGGAAVAIGGAGYNLEVGGGGMWAVVETAVSRRVHEIRVGTVGFAGVGLVVGVGPTLAAVLDAVARSRLGVGLVRTSGNAIAGDIFHEGGRGAGVDTDSAGHVSKLGGVETLLDAGESAVFSVEGGGGGADGDAGAGGAVGVEVS